MLHEHLNHWPPLPPFHRRDPNVTLPVMRCYVCLAFPSRVTWFMDVPLLPGSTAINVGAFESLSLSVKELSVADTKARVLLYISVYTMQFRWSKRVSPILLRYERPIRLSMNVCSFWVSKINALCFFRKRVNYLYTSRCQSFTEDFSFSS